MRRQRDDASAGFPDIAEVAVRIQRVSGGEKTIGRLYGTENSVLLPLMTLLTVRAGK